MTNMLEIILGFSIGGALVAMMAIGIVLSALIPVGDRWSKRYFIVFFSLLFLCSVSCYCALIFWYSPNMAAVERIVYFVESLFLSTLMVLPTVFLLHCCGESVGSNPLFRTSAALWGEYFVLVIVAQFTDDFYYVTQDNQFFRGPLFALLMLPLAVIMILNIASTIYRRHKLSKRYFVALLVYMVPMTAALIIHMFVSVELFVVFCMALFALLMYGMIISDNMIQYTRQQREIANQRASVMVLQMRPHFIYNTMMGIYYLCDQDPQKAKQVTMDFTTYLRKNFTAIASEKPVSFSAELEHTRAYLAVEKAQFEDSLFVEFDTPHVSFRLPPLTLQPIVENAVKHGTRASNEPIHIAVITRKTETASEIIVEDDGPGFTPSDDNDPHLALDNIRLRLEWMCSGTLSITPREDGGTSVKVTIPDRPPAGR